MREIRPRNARLFMSDAREKFEKSPFALKVTNRKINAQGAEEMDISLYRIEDFDVEFASNFFYLNDTSKEAGRAFMLVVPFKLNGDDY